MSYHGVTVFPPADLPRRQKFLEAMALLHEVAPRSFRRLERYAGGGVRDGIADAYLHLTQVASVRVAADSPVEEIAGNLAFQAGVACASARWKDRSAAETDQKLWRAGAGEKSRLLLVVAQLCGAGDDELDALSEQLREARTRGAEAVAEAHKGALALLRQALEKAR